MVKNLKFHIIAVSLICLIVVVLYEAIGANTPEPSALAPSNRYVRISSASWGLNCNPSILSVKQAQASASLKKDAHGKIILSTPLKLVTVNNVIDAVKKLCDGKSACEFYASNDVLGLDPIEGCFKKLNLHYRCLNADRLTITEVNQGELFKVNCAMPVTVNAPTAATTQP